MRAGDFEAFLETLNKDAASGCLMFDSAAGNNCLLKIRKSTFKKKKKTPG